jgi:hypothetical protein
LELPTYFYPVMIQKHDGTLFISVPASQPWTFSLNSFTNHSVFGVIMVGVMKESKFKQKITPNANKASGFIR